MRTTASTLPDWRDPAAYAPLLEADRSLLAWEWLRRDPRYRAVAWDSLSSKKEPKLRGRGSEAFGLVCFEDPAVAVPGARPVWSAQIHPYVLCVRPRCSKEAGDRFDPKRFGTLARLAQSGSRDHLLLCDGFRAIRIDGPAGTFGRPGGLDFVIGGVAAARRPVVTLQRFLALVRSGRFSRVLHRREPRARRWILMLRAWDALQAGATQREIAAALISSSAGDRGWRSREPSIRSQAQRLAALARHQAAGAYRTLLR